jgi:hypothetical protein
MDVMKNTLKEFSLSSSSSSAIANKLSRNPFFAAGTGRSSSFLSVGKFDVQLVRTTNLSCVLCVFGGRHYG